MKLILEAAEHNQAVEEFIKNHHGLEVTVNHLEDINIDFDITQVTKPVEEPEDTERKEAMKRADELGIQYRSNILTSTLIERIEEAEEELVSTVKQQEQSFEEVNPSLEEEPVLEDSEDLYPTKPSFNIFEAKQEEKAIQEEPKKTNNIFAGFKRNEAED